MYMCILIICLYIYIYICACVSLILKSVGFGFVQAQQGIRVLSTSRPAAKLGDLVSPVSGCSV